jgi:hypothetical protein
LWELAFLYLTNGIPVFPKWKNEPFAGETWNQVSKKKLNSAKQSLLHLTTTMHANCSEIIQMHS